MNREKTETFKTEKLNKQEIISQQTENSLQNTEMFLTKNMKNW